MKKIIRYYSVALEQLRALEKIDYEIRNDLILKSTRENVNMCKISLLK